MKSKKLIYLEKILRLMAKAVLRRHNPQIVAITGSVGKTSAKAAVFTVLSSKFNVRENQKNYNNEIGIPLTIIGAESGGKNMFRWAWVLLKWIWALIYPVYPKFLVIELGVDRPGDMNYFMTFIHPTVGVVTNISLSHLEFFKTVDNIAKEKRVLIESLGKDGFAILNLDDEKVAQMSEHTKAQTITFGQAPEATVSASNIIYNYQDGKPEGISFKLNYDGKNIPVRLKNILAAHTVYAALVGISVGIMFKINLVEIAEAIQLLKSPTGRMNFFEGINGSYIIDDTYNASPISTIAAVSVLAELKAKRKIAVLGDMLELGDQSEKGHRDVARKIFESKVDLFVAVGRRMQDAVDELKTLGFPEKNIFYFDDSLEAMEKVLQLVGEGDFILVKGSQGMRMEKIVEKLLVDSAQAEKLLCRQSLEWKKIPVGRP